MALLRGEGPADAPDDAEIRFGVDVLDRGVDKYDEVLGTKCSGVLLLNRRPNREDPLSGVDPDAAPLFPLTRPSIIDESSSLEK